MRQIVQMKSIRLFLLWAFVLAVSFSSGAESKSASHEFVNRFSLPDRDYHLTMLKELKSLAAQYKASANETTGKFSELLFQLNLACLDEAKIHEDIASVPSYYFDLNSDDFDPSNANWVKDSRRGAKAADRVNLLFKQAVELGYSGPRNLRYVLNSVSPSYKHFTTNDRLNKAKALRAEASTYKRDASTASKPELAQVLLELAGACSSGSDFEENATKGRKFLSVGEQEKCDNINQRIEGLRKKAVSLGYTLPPEAKSMDYMSSMHKAAYRSMLKTIPERIKTLEGYVAFYKNYDAKGSAEVTRLCNEVAESYEKIIQDHEQDLENLKTEHSLAPIHDSSLRLYEMYDVLNNQLKELQKLDPKADAKLQMPE